MFWFPRLSCCFNHCFVGANSALLNHSNRITKLLPQARRGTNVAAFMAPKNLIFLKIFSSL